MSRPCSICSSPFRADIDKACLEAKPLREILAAFPNARLSQSAIDRHRRHHLSALLRQAREARDAEAGTDLLAAALEKLTAIEGEAKRLAAAAEAKGQFAVAGNLLVAQAVRLVELSSRLRGLLSANSVQVGVAVTSPEFQRAAEDAWRDRLVALIREQPMALRAATIAWLKEKHRTLIDVGVVEGEADSLRDYPEGTLLGADACARLVALVRGLRPAWRAEVLAALGADTAPPKALPAIAGGAADLRDAQPLPEGVNGEVTPPGIALDIPGVGEGTVYGLEHVRPEARERLLRLKRVLPEGIRRGGC